MVDNLAILIYLSHRHTYIYISKSFYVFRFSQIISEYGMGMALSNNNNNGGEFRPAQL